MSSGTRTKESCQGGALASSIPRSLGEYTQGAESTRGAHGLRQPEVTLSMAWLVYQPESSSETEVIPYVHDALLI